MSIVAANTHARGTIGVDKYLLSKCCLCAVASRVCTRVLALDESRVCVYVCVWLACARLRCERKQVLCSGFLFGGSATTQTIKHTHTHGTVSVYVCVCCARVLHTYPSSFSALHISFRWTVLCVVKRNSVYYWRTRRARTHGEDVVDVNVYAAE